MGGGFIDRSAALLSAAERHLECALRIGDIRFYNDKQALKYITQSRLNRIAAVVKISVVIPVYNAERWIADTLESLLGQTYPHSKLEVIIVDNGSTDRSVELAKIFLNQAGFYHRILHEDRRDVSIVRNRGISSSHGDWIQFLDADDILHPEKLALQSEVAQTSSGEIGVIYSSWRMLRERKGIWLLEGETKMPKIDINDIGSFLIDGNFLHLGSALFRRDALDGVAGFREGIGIIEDVDLTLRLAMTGMGFAVCDSKYPLFYYRKHRTGSLSTVDHKDFIMGCIRNIDLVYEWANSNGMLDESLRSTLINCYFKSARNLAGLDWNKFRDIVGRIHRLDSNFIPNEPLLLALTAQIMGYESAEKIAFYYRTAKAKLKGNREQLS